MKKIEQWFNDSLIFKVCLCLAAKPGYLIYFPFIFFRFTVELRQFSVILIEALHRYILTNKTQNFD
jgi:hypothetical protein